MENFVFENKTKIIFGKDSEKSVGKEIAGIGKKILLHYGGGSIKKTGLYDRIKESLDKKGVDYVELGGVQPNPRLTLVHQGIELCRKENVDAILAVGGGSVIDSAKAIGVGVFYNGDVWDFYMGKAQPEKMLSLGVVLTIPAAGSEASFSSVISNDELKLKKGLTHELLRPDFAILNPELTYTLPDFQTACGVSDMLAHVMERYFSPTKNVALSDQLCEGLMRTIIEYGLKVIKNPKDYDIRAEILWAGTLAHNDLAGMGRTGDWSSHGIEHELSALFDVAHGAGLSVIFPAWMRHVYQENPDRMYQFATRVWEIKEENREKAIHQAIEKLESFYRALGLPVRLNELNIQEDSFDQMAEKATGNGSWQLGAFKKLDKDDVKTIYKLAK